MSNLSKIALNRTSDILRNIKEFENNFNVQTLSKTLFETDSVFCFNLKAKNKVYITFSANVVCGFKVYVNSKIEYVCANDNFKTFYLQLNGNAEIKIKVFNFTQNVNVNLTFMGNFNFVNKNNLIFIPLLTGVFAIKKTDGAFTLFNVGSMSNEVLDINQCSSVNYDYEFVSCCSGLENSFILCKNNGVSNVFVNLQIKLQLQKLFSDNAQIFTCNNYGASFGVADIVGNKIELTLYNSSGNIVCETTVNKTTKFGVVTSIKTVTNLHDNLVYFVLTDVNNNNEIVLCNFNESGLTAEFLGCFNVGKGSIICVTKTQENVFVFAVCVSDFIKIYTYNLNFVSGIKQVQNVVTHQNASVACLLKSNYILNYDNTLVLI